MPREREIRIRCLESHHTLIGMAAFAAGCDISEYAREAAVRRAMKDYSQLSPELKAIVERELSLAGAEAVSSRRFVPPTLEEVSAFVSQKGYHFDPETFVSYWEARAWRFNGGRGALMKNWKAACVTFEKNDASFGAHKTVEHRLVGTPEEQAERERIAKNKAQREREEEEKLRLTREREKELKEMGL